MAAENVFLATHAALKCQQMASSRISDINKVDFAVQISGKSVTQELKDNSARWRWLHIMFANWSGRVDRDNFHIAAVRCECSLLRK